MKFNKWPLCLVALAMIGGTAVVLSRLTFELGKPGVKVVNEAIYNEDGKIATTNRVELPAVVLNYESTLLPLTKIELATLPRDTTFGRREYRAPDGFQARMDVVLMGADRTSIHKPQICLTAQGWKIDASTSKLVDVPVSQPHAYPLQVMRLLADKTAKASNGADVRARAVLAYWFVTDGAMTGRHDARMWWMAKELLRGGALQRWAYVTCLSICQPGDEEKTFTRMKDLIAASVPQFQLVPKATNAVANPETATK